MGEKKFDPSQIKEIDRGVYDFFNDFEYADISDKGVNAKIVLEISKKKMNQNG